MEEGGNGRRKRGSGMREERNSLKLIPILTTQKDQNSANGSIQTGREDELHPRRSRLFYLFDPPSFPSIFLSFTYSNSFFARFFLFH